MDRPLTSQYIPRFPDDVIYLSADIAERSLFQRLVSIDGTERSIADDPGMLLQRRYGSLAFDHECVALYYYALGFPLAQVREQLTHSASYAHKVFELRGTQDAFEAYSL